MKGRIALLVAGIFIVLAAWIASQTPTGPHSRVYVSDNATPPFQAWIDESGGDMRFTDNSNSNITLSSLVAGGAVPWTAVPSDVIPDADSTRDLGENGTPKRWAEIWGDQVDGGNLRITGSTLSNTQTNGNIVISPDGTGTVQFQKSMVVSAATHDLGTAAVPLDDVHFVDWKSGTNGGVAVETDLGITIELDADNDGSNQFEIRDGTSATVLIVDESGNITHDGNIIPDVTDGDDLGSTSVDYDVLYINSIEVDTAINDTDDADTSITFGGLNADMTISVNAGANDLIIDGDLAVNDNIIFNESASNTIIIEQIQGTVDATDGNFNTFYTYSPADADTSIYIKAEVTFKNDTSNESAFYCQMTLFEENAGTLAKIGTTVDVGEVEDDAAWDMQAIVSGTDIVLQYDDNIEANTTYFSGLITIIENED